MYIFFNGSISKELDNPSTNSNLNHYQSMRSFPRSSCIPMLLSVRRPPDRDKKYPNAWALIGWKTHRSQVKVGPAPQDTCQLIALFLFLWSPFFWTGHPSCWIQSLCESLPLPYDSCHLLQSLTSCCFNPLLLFFCRAGIVACVCLQWEGRSAV